MKLVWLVCLILLVGCSADNGFDQYTQMVKTETKSGKRNDSIFFGIRLGMTGKEFFTYCWEMNNKGVFTDGQANTKVLYKLDRNELKYPASMNFYPEIYDNKVRKMEATFQYDAWAPWNKHLFADSLLEDVFQLFTVWYKSGNPFIKITDPKRGILYVKVDGNRRIILAKKNDLSVKADYTDMLYVPVAIKAK